MKFAVLDAVGKDTYAKNIKKIEKFFFEAVRHTLCLRGFCAGKTNL